MQKNQHDGAGSPQGLAYRDGASGWPDSGAARRRYMIAGLCAPPKSAFVWDGASSATAQLEHLLGVEDLVVGSEQLLNCFLVDLHLGAADAQRAPGADVVALGVLVGGLDPFDAQGRDGVQVDQRP